MKHTSIATTLALTLSFELIVAPVVPHLNALAQTPPPANTDSSTITESGNTTPPARQQSGWTAENISGGIRQLSNLWTTANGIMNPAPVAPSHLSADMQELGSQQMGQPDKFFNAQKLMQIPGLATYLALNNKNPAMLNCETLKTTLHEAKPEVCRLGVTQDSSNGPQNAQLEQMKMYHDQYFKISKQYNNFMADSNADGQAFGIGCMKNAMNILNGFFKYRIDELDKLTTNLEAMQNQFREASRADLDAIEETVAVLDGDSPIADKVRSKKPDLFDFGKRFNNPACNSMFAGDAINEKGRSEGLNKINQDLKKTLSEKSGKFSGESYAKSHTAVLEDINGLADRVSKQMELNFGVLSKDPNSYGKFLNELPDMVSSPNGTNQALSPDLFSDVRTKFNETYIKLNEQKGTIQSELTNAGVSPDAATVLLGNPSSQNFENEVATIENKVKNKCFQSSFSADTVLSKIYDPTASGHANKFASNFLKDKLNSIINDDSSTLEKKLAQLQALESQNGGRYYMKMENSYEVQEVDGQGNLTTKVVGASEVRTPSVFFSDIIKNCNSQFKANKLDNKMTGAGAIQKLKQLNQDFKNLAKDQALDIKRELRKKLIECSSPEEANNTVAGSCTPERFNTSAPGFCANAALSCSKNMQACSQQADTFVKEIKAQKTARVNNYKALLQKNKQDVVKMFDSALSRYMKDAEMMRGMFGAGFTSPTGIQREVPEGERYLSEFTQSTGKSIDGRLLLEDPDKYTNMFKENISLLKDSVQKQQNQILGGESVGNNNGLLADHIKKTEKNFRDVASQSQSMADKCIGQYDAAVKAANQQLAQQQKDFAKQQSELGQKQQEFCQRFNQAVGGHPGPACDGNIGDLVRSVGNQGNKFAAYCDAAQNNSSSGTSSSAVKAFRICDAEQTDTKLQAACKKYKDCNQKVANTTSTTTSYVKICPDEEIQAYVENILALKNEAPTLSADSAPAFCTAGNNSGREDSPKGWMGAMDTFNTELRKSLSPQVQGN